MKLAEAMERLNAFDGPHIPQPVDSSIIWSQFKHRKTATNDNILMPHTKLE